MLQTTLMIMAGVTLYALARIQLAEGHRDALTLIVVFGGRIAGTFIILEALFMIGKAGISAFSLRGIITLLTVLVGIVACKWLANSLTRHNSEG